MPPPKNTKKSKYTRQQLFKIRDWYKNNPAAQKIRDEQRKKLRLEAQMNVRERQQKDYARQLWLNPIHQPEEGRYPPLSETNVNAETELLEDRHLSHFPEDEWDAAGFDEALLEAAEAADVLQEPDQQPTPKKSKSEHHDQLSLPGPSTSHKRPAQTSSEEIEEAGLYPGRKRQQIITEEEVPADKFTVSHYTTNVKEKTFFIIHCSYENFNNVIDLFRSIYYSQIEIVHKNHNNIIIKHPTKINNTNFLYHLKQNGIISDYFKLHFPGYKPDSQCLEITLNLSAHNVN